jgi:phage I-like protein
MTEPQTPPSDCFELTSFGQIDLIELAGGARKLPTEICLFKSGTTETSKGQFVCDATAAKFTIDNVRAHYGDALTNFDYGHGQVGFVQTADSAKSAGWAKLAERDGSLWATDIEWTPAAQRALLDREFRFFSPTVYRDPETKRITNLVNVALTNLPATKGQRPIVTAQEFTMAEQQKPTEPVATPKSEPTDLAALQASNAQLLSAVSQLQASLNQAQTELSTVAAERAKNTKASFIAKLSQDGKLPPALQTWALGQDLAVLEAFAKDAPVLAPASADATVTPKVPAVTAASVELSADERKIISASQISESDYLATRAHLLSSGNPWAFNPLNMTALSAKDGK